jgi:hypothetical protein
MSFLTMSNGTAEGMQALEVIRLAQKDGTLIVDSGRGPELRFQGHRSFLYCTLQQHMR